MAKIIGRHGDNSPCYTEGCKLGHQSSVSVALAAQDFNAFELAVERQNNLKLEELDKKYCGDYPAPCNCDNPDTHDGAVPANEIQPTIEEKWEFFNTLPVTQVSNDHSGSYRALTEDEFENEFKPVMFDEQSGSYLQNKDDLVASYPANQIWTQVESGGSLLILAGIHHVNRTDGEGSYIATEKPWVTGSEEVMWYEASDDDLDEDDPYDDPIPGDEEE